MSDLLGSADRGVGHGGHRLHEPGAGRGSRRTAASTYDGTRRSLGIDEGRIGVWACSGNVPLALSAPSTHAARARLTVRRAALRASCCDLDERDRRRRGARPRSVSPIRTPASRSMTCAEDLAAVHRPRRPGAVSAGLNDLDRPLLRRRRWRSEPADHALVNHATGPHSFDLLHDSDTSRAHHPAGARLPAVPADELIALSSG